MDSKHRHELKTNELADWIANSPEYLKKNYLQVIGVVLIVFAILFSRPIRNRIESSKLAAQAETTSTIRKAERSKYEAVTTNTEGPLIVASNELEIASQSAKTQKLAALALIKRAEAIRASLHLAPTEPDAEAARTELSQAKEAYNLAIAKADGDQTLIAKANFGLGLCDEDAGELDSAKEIYNNIIADKAFASTVFPSLAQNRIDSMQDNTQRFAFAEATKPEEPAEPAFEMPKPVIPSPPAE